VWLAALLLIVVGVLVGFARVEEICPRLTPPTAAPVAVNPMPGAAPGAPGGPVRVRLVAHTVVLAQGQAQGGDQSGVLLAVIDRFRRWVMMFLAALATLAMTIGGVRYLLADGRIEEIEAAKRAFKGAAIGYALAALAPALVSILRNIVGF
jgi:hypothetical protein